MISFSAAKRIKEKKSFRLSFQDVRIIWNKLMWDCLLVLIGPCTLIIHVWMNG